MAAGSCTRFAACAWLLLGVSGFLVADDEPAELPTAPPPRVVETVATPQAALIAPDGLPRDTTSDPLNRLLDHGLIGGSGKNPVAYMSAGAGGVPVMPMYFLTKSTFALT